ncbi:hypothetical protein [Streptomyces sp. NPDC058092]|uniref:hypothetical protein n=1 Tax=Streptomyces sp. NPDC058092 TaxID=3346336 RepID=UPI0036E129C4
MRIRPATRRVLTVSGCLVFRAGPAELGDGNAMLLLDPSTDDRPARAGTRL